MNEYDDLFSDASDPLKKIQEIPEFMTERRNAKTLLNYPISERDSQWLIQFNEALIEAPVCPRTPPVSKGPDGFNYVMVDFAHKNSEGKKTTINRILSKALEKGVGVALNMTASGVDWVLSYGDLFALKHFGTLNIPQLPKIPQAKLSGAERANAPKEAVKTGPASEKRLPDYVRKAIKRHMIKQMGVSEPSVFVMMRDDKTQSENLVFNIFPEDYPSREAFEKDMAQISWFLPRHYHLLSIKKSANLAKEFVIL